MSKKEKSQKGHNEALLKKNRYRGLFLGIGLFIVIVVGGFVGYYFWQQHQGFDEQELANMQPLEAYVLEEYTGNKNVYDIQYGFRDTSSDNIILTDYSDTDETIDPYDLDHFAGMVEFDDMYHIYDFANGYASNDSPRVEALSRRVPILKYDTNGIPEFYSDVYFDGDGNIDLDMNYFIGQKDHALVQIGNDDYSLVQTIRYVQPDTFQYIVAELLATTTQRNGGQVDISEVKVDDKVYLKYETVDTGDQNNELNEN